jgi:hypothetical protein
MISAMPSCSATRSIGLGGWAVRGDADAVAVELVVVLFVLFEALRVSTVCVFMGFLSGWWW